MTGRAIWAGSTVDEFDSKLTLNPVNPKHGADIARAVMLLEAMGADISRAIRYVETGPPFSKSRPRFSRNGGVYVKKGDRAAEDRTRAAIRAAGIPQFPGNVAMLCLFYRPNFQRIDVDNMLKHVCDAANGIMWADDSQVTALVGLAELDADDPRTVVVAAPHESTLGRGVNATVPCLVCGALIVSTGVSKRPKTCSRQCAARFRFGHNGLDEPVDCLHCGEPFRRTTQYQRYCSPECRVEPLRNANRSRGKPLSKCWECGVTLAHHRGGRCRNCWRLNPGLRIEDVKRETCSICGAVRVVDLLATSSDGLRFCEGGCPA